MKMHYVVLCGCGVEEATLVKGHFQRQRLRYRMIGVATSLKSFQAQIPAFGNEMGKQSSDSQIVIFLSRDLKRNVRLQITEAARSSFPGSQIHHGLEELEDSFRDNVG